MVGMAHGQAGDGRAPLRVLRVGEVDLDLDGLAVRGPRGAAPLSYREFLLLRCLMDNAGRVMTRDELMDAGWGDSPLTTGKKIDVYVGRLRGALSRCTGAEHVRTVRSVGYVFDLPESL